MLGVWTLCGQNHACRRGSRKPHKKPYGKRHLPWRSRSLNTERARIETAQQAPVAAQDDVARSTQSERGLKLAIAPASSLHSGRSLNTERARIETTNDRLPARKGGVARSTQSERGLKLLTHGAKRGGFGGRSLNTERARIETNVAYGLPR